MSKTPTEAEIETEALMNALISFGEQMLERRGDFFPYGGAMKTNGEIISVVEYDGSDQPPSQNVIDQLRNNFSLAAKEGKYKATGIFFDVRIIPPYSAKKTDAIAVALDHKENYSIIVFLPYTLKNSKVEFGELFIKTGAHDIFSF